MKITPTHYLTPLLQTPFHARTAALNRHHRWGNWAGFQSALCFGDVEMEYTAIRNGATVYDLCPMTKYRFTGPDAARCLDRLTTRNVAKLAVGGVHYTCWCDDAGQIIDDGTLFRHGPQDFLLCCQERHLPWLLDSAHGFDVHIAEVTHDIAALSLQGPCTAAVLQAAGFDVFALKPFRMATFPFAGGTLTISRTGFTGDLGFELWITPDKALALWDHLFAAGLPWNIRPIGSDALDMARIEAGFLIAGQDFIPAEQALREDRTRSPLELGLDWLIDWQKGHFNGRRALVAERDSGSSRWALVGLDLAGNVSGEGSIIYHNKSREVGVITAAVWSPVTKRNLALAQIMRPYHDGRNLWVEIYALRELHYVKLMVPARVADRPFFKPARRFATPAGVM
jgi:aminomethyltransferase